MEDQGGHIPRFGDWKTGHGDATPYTMYFDDARLRRSTGGTTPPPKPRPATPSRGNSTPPTHRRAGAANNPNKPKDRTTSRSRRQSSVGHGGSVPTWGQWNDGNAQQYTLVFDQIREERRSVPSTPNIERPPPPTPPRKKPQSQHDHVPKIFTCFGLFGK